MTGADEAVGTERGQTLRALLLLLPAAALALPPPVSPLADDPYPFVSGAGWVALLALPAALHAGITGGPRPAGAALLPLVALGVGLLARAFGGLTDTLEADRALLHGVAFLALLVAASGLREDGRTVLTRGLVVLSILWSAVALLQPTLTGRLGYEGVLGNTGALSQAALPGAVVGAWRAATRRGAWGLAGLVAAALFAGHAALAPVLAGAGAFVVALTASALAAPAATWLPRARAALGGLAALALFGVLVAVGADRAVADEEAALAEAGQAPAVAGDTGGVAVRLAVWARVPGLVLDHAVLGVGPGQTAAAFVPYRDADEIEASTHARTAGPDSEVDHVHHDALHGVVDAGVVGGAAWVLFLLAGARAALAALRGQDARRAGLGAAVLAVLVNGLAHGPLLWNPASMAVAAVALGALLVGDGRAATLGRPLAAALAAALVAGVFTAVELVRHGRALSARTQLVDRYEVWADAVDPATPRDELRRIEGEFWEEEARILARAVEARPDSVPAWLYTVLHLSSAGLDDDKAVGEVLARRPHHVQARSRRGELEAAAGDGAAARATWEAVLADDPGHPPTRHRLAELDLREGATADGLARLRALAEDGRLNVDWTRSTARALVRAGRLDGALGTWLAGEPGLAEAPPEHQFARADEAAAAGDDRAEASLRGAAHWLWARRHAEEARWHDAVRSYRQAAAQLRGATDGASPAALEAEHGAALLRDDDPARAAEHLDGLDVAALDLPAWARAALDE